MAPVDLDMLGGALDALREGIQILSPEWRYLYVNAAAARHGKKPREELLGRSLLEVYPGFDMAPVFGVMKRCLVERRHETLENEFSYEDGTSASFELRVQPCPAGIAIVSVDITERRKREQDEREAHLDVLRALASPVVRVHRGVLLVPLVGALDSERASHMTEGLLTRLVAEQARVVILDVAGVQEMDTNVAQHLLQTTAAVRLLGAKTILTGIAPSTAKTMVHLGVDLASMQTTTDLAAGIELALAAIGKTIAPR